MHDALQGLHPDLRRRVLAVARQCRRARSTRNWMRFGLVAFILTGLTTAFLSIGAPDMEGGPLLLVLWAFGMGLAAWRWVVRPMFRPITLEQVALFIDEQHPEFHNRVASAVEFTEHQPEGSSNWLVSQFLNETAPIVREANLDKLMDDDGPWFRGLAAAVLLLVTLGTVFTFDSLWFPTFGVAIGDGSARFVSLPFTVEPGDVRVRRGDNQMVWVQSDKPDLKMTLNWRDATGSWLSNALEQSSTDNMYYHQFSNIQEDIEYQVHFNNRRSETFTITVWSPPEVETIDLTYNYPDYLNQPVREVPNSGNITAVEGTQVDLSVWANKKIAKAEMVLDSGERIPLEERADALWAGRITLERDDGYHIELVDLEDAPSEYNHEYNITVQRDKPPQIKIEFPRGDSEVSMLEEVPFDFQVSDDNGFSEFGLQYEISGREPVRLALNSEDQFKTEAEGHHQILLEDLGLTPGDLITWTIWAKDAKPNRRDFEELGDPFFLEIRPFQVRYSEAMSGAGMQSGQQGNEDPALKMKDIIIATWNLRRDAYWLVEEEFTEKRGIVVTELEALKAEVSQAMGMGTANMDLLSLNEAMREAVELLQQAEMPEPEDTLSEAMTAEQRAYRMLLKMVPRDRQVQQQQGGGGGGGGGGERPDISALEMERNRNFYEEENVTQQEQEAAERVLSRIKELAQRQQLVNEEIEKLISEIENATSEEEREELKRRLERLEEELRENLERIDETRQELASEGLSNEQVRETQESLRDAREQVNRSLEQLNEERLQEARASGNRAMDSLGDIEQYLQQFSRGGAAQRLKELQDRFEDLKQRQEQIAQQAGEMQEQHNNPSLEGQENVEEAIDEMLQQKAALMDEFADAMSEGGELAERSSESQELMSRKLGDWLRDTSREGIVEDIEESMPLVKYGVWDTAKDEEQRIAQKLNDAVEKLGDVADSLVEDDIEGMQKALENLDKLMGGRESRIARNNDRQTNELDSIPLGQFPGDELDPNAAGGQPVEDGQQQGQQSEQPGSASGMRPGAENSDNRAGQQGEQEGARTVGTPGAQGDPESQLMAGGTEQPQQPDAKGQLRSPAGNPPQTPNDSQGESPEGQQQSEAQQQGTQQGQSASEGGEQPGGQQQGSQPGEQESEQGQQGQQPGSQSGNRAGNNNQPNGTPGSPGSPWGNGGPGGFDGNWDWVPRDMNQWVNQDYQEWIERLRNAESLLPENSEFRPEITRLRESIETMRRAFRERQLAPKFDLFLEMVASPLAETADELQREIEKRLNEKEFVLADEGDIPERYRQRVADYFKQLSDSESTR